MRMGVSAVILVPVIMMIVVVERTSAAVMFGWSADLDLQRCMPDAEALLELMLHVRQEAVAGMSTGHDQMAGQRRLSGTHGPDVEMMNVSNAGQTFQSLPHIADGNIAWHTLKRQCQRLPQQI